MHTLDFKDRMDSVWVAKEQYDVLVKVYPDFKGILLGHLIIFCCKAYAIKVRQGDDASDKQLREIMDWVYREKKGHKTELSMKHWMKWCMIYHAPAMADYIIRNMPKGRG